jgi:hypothetical protein
MQHYRVDLQQAAHLYKNGDLTAKGAIKLWIRIKLKTGWEGFFDTTEIRNIFGMKRSTFWLALGKLEEEVEIQISEPHKIHIKRLTNPSESDSDQNSGQESQKMDDYPENCTEDQNSGQESQKIDDYPENRTEDQYSGQPSNKLDNQDLEPLPEEEPVKPHISSDSFQIFSDSLSQEQREDFYKFGEEKAKQLPKPPVLTRKWIEKNWEAIKAEWKPVTTQSALNWETDPRTKGWFEEVYECGNPMEFALGDDEKMAFVDWAYENDKWEWEWKK